MQKETMKASKMERHNKYKLKFTGCRTTFRKQLEWVLVNKVGRKKLLRIQQRNQGDGNTQGSQDLESPVRNFPTGEEEERGAEAVLYAIV